VQRLIFGVVVLMLVTACGKRVPGPISASRGTSELEGLASYYAEPYTGRRTASGEIFDTYQELTAAHRTLPFNTLVRVTNESNGRDVNVRINDRGPFVKGRVIDLSYKAAKEIDMVRAGVAPVKLTILRDAADAAAKVSRQPEPLPPPSSPSALYTIQVGAFPTEDAAQILKRDLERRYSDVTVVTFTTTLTFYRVRVGRLSDLPSAEALVKTLRQEKFDPFVVRLN
jgi:rare lipoprotein A